MEKNYYNILGVSQVATEEEIRKAYKKLALKYHPDKNQQSADSERFTEIREAYEVLINPSKRQAYDQSVQTEHHESLFSFSFDTSFSPPLSFAASFPSFSLFTPLVVPDHVCTGQFIGAPCQICNTLRTPAFQQFNVPRMPTAQNAPRSQPMELNLFLSLEEINSGCVRFETINRLAPTADGRVCSEVRHLRVNIDPGWLDGTKVTFQREGDRLPGHVPADVVFTIRDKKHEFFKRDGHNIYYVAKITLKEALCGTVLQIPSLSGKTIGVDTTGEVITPDTMKRVDHEGLPYSDKPNKRGFMIIKFDIKFPKQLDQNAKEILLDLIPDEK